MRAAFYLSICLSIALLNASCGGARGGNAVFTPVAPTVTSARLTGDSLQVTGQNLGNITGLTLKQAGRNVALSILSKSGTGIVARLASNYLVQAGVSAELEMQMANVTVAATLTVDLNGTTLVQSFQSTGIDDNATSTAMTIDAAENIGIGTTNPGYKLEVGTAVNTGAAAFFAPLSTTAGNEFIDLYLGKALVAGQAAIFRFYQNATAANGYLSILVGGDSSPTGLNIAKGGNVGVGTVSPASKFVVAPPTTETIAAAAVITADACGTIKAIDAGGGVTTNTTNTFTAPTASYAGCCMDVINVDAADTITLDANANFKTAAGANQALGPLDTIRVCSDGSVWYQMGAISANN